ncbi:deoxyguanosinetriphosphate triphosphohydrolase [Sciscionella marina]|uniref:deoxyguanosinetriphosphate triphosphohydrolase n=1 Tax=Sciscionella marina TaxID=508770 RepID=UPI00036E2FB5|nr:deoxyguanosinetriphosphate triphosphohydrolase [Sciscionella marina]
MRFEEQRAYTEPVKFGALPAAEVAGRGPFARDRARVLHSAALRRLAGKTQVVGPGEGQGHAAPRTRLTHSLEVAQIGREIAEGLGADPDVVDTAGLAHDIGHPPFGHNGEWALDEAGTDCGGFEGNAQTLRILTRLEPKVLGADGRSYGLNLTRACLDAATKYPWPRGPDSAKFGVYADDFPVFTWMREGTPGTAVCLEAQVMDWSDDVAYSVHDVEDGVLAGRVELSALADASERADLARLAVRNYTAIDPAEVETAAQELLAIPSVAELAKHGFDGTLRAHIALKQLTSELVGRFATAPVAATRSEYGAGRLSRYAAGLVVPTGVRAEVALLKAVALRYVMSDPRRLALQRRQRELLAELIAALRGRVDRLDPVHAAALRAARGEAEGLRVVLDQVASLTDEQALAWHRRFHREYS